MNPVTDLNKPITEFRERRDKQLATFDNIESVIKELETKLQPVLAAELPIPVTENKSLVNPSCELFKDLELLHFRAAHIRSLLESLTSRIVSL